MPRFDLRDAVKHVLKVPKCMCRRRHMSEHLEGRGFVLRQILWVDTMKQKMQHIAASSKLSAIAAYLIQHLFFDVRVS
jgi:hypothetical protein